MVIKSHILGYPRIGPKRETKKAVEAYWAKKSSRDELLQAAYAVRQQNWETQIQAGLDFLTVGDYHMYDHVLDMSVMFGAIPPRFMDTAELDKVAEAVASGSDSASLLDYSVDTMFRLGRGDNVPACEMTKWFDTNYHYMVPEFHDGQKFQLASLKLIDEVKSAKKFLEESGNSAQLKVALLGPVSYLWLGKEKSLGLDRSTLFSALIPVYLNVLAKLKELGVEWVQIDEPVLGMDVEDKWRVLLSEAFTKISQTVPDLKVIVTSFFVDVAKENVETLKALSVEGVHLDLVRGSGQVKTLVPELTKIKTLSVGVVNGRNIWRNDLSKTLKVLEEAKKAFKGENLFVSSSCSILHSPVDLDSEKKLDPEIKQWLAFGKQKVVEIVALAKALSGDKASVASAFESSDAAAKSRVASTKIHNAAVKERMAKVTDAMAERKSAYPARAAVQRSALKLPAFPTTTIGSFPQTVDIRRDRRLYKSGKLSEAEYVKKMQDEIKMMVEEQDKLDLDVYVHGEPERNDMVEYFGELLDGFAFTTFGWVQSYGSRCVKPPIIFGDVSRPKPMTVEWSTFAQSLTNGKYMKGMLTGPVTILCWSFVRDDQPREATANQIALALRDEVLDLEKNGIQIIQIDEPAFREGLPLRVAEHDNYLKWAVNAFRLSAGGNEVQDSTQIHTHMCYSEFNILIKPISAMDADVITIETSRSDMKLLQAFEDFKYPNEIGPGVYDIHSPRVPDQAEMLRLLKKAAEKIEPSRLWVNPDCGLKTRAWPETRGALEKMVSAAKEMRKIYA